MPEYQHPHVVNEGRRKLIELFAAMFQRESRERIETLIDTMIDREWVSGSFYMHAAQFKHLRMPISYSDDIHGSATSSYETDEQSDVEQ